MRAVGILSGFFGGVFFGVAANIIMMFVIGFASWATKEPVAIPGLFWAEVTPGDGVPEVAFLPNATGLLAVILACGVIAAFAAAVGKPKAA